MPRLSLLLLAICASTSPAPDPGDLIFAPDEGTSRAKVFTTATEAAITEVKVLVDGEEQPTRGEQEFPGFASHTVIAVVDRLSAPDADRPGAPSRVLRGFARAERTRTLFLPDGEEVETAEAAEVVDAAVEFLWDDDDESYVASDPDEQLDDTTLAGLVEDMSLRGFLPDGAVEEGDTWEVDVAEYAKLMWPGGELGWINPETGERDPGREAIIAQLLENIEGEITATYAGLGESDDAEVARIEIQIEATTSATEVMEATREQQGGEQTIEFVREVEGVLLWDLERGVMHSLSMEGLANEVTRQTVEVQDRSGTVELVRESLFEGTITYDVVASDAE